MGEGPFRLADGIEVVRVSEERFMLRSDYLALEMSGEAAALFAERVLTRLRQPHRLEDVLRLLPGFSPASVRSEEHTSELQSRENLVCRLLLEKKKSRKTLPQRESGQSHDVRRP